MFHIGRCGSTVLGQLLGQHPRICWASELYGRVFTEWRRQNGGVEVVREMPEDAIRMLRRDMRSALHRFYGVEIKPFHLRLIGYSADAMLRHLDDLGFTHFILLDRRNGLRKVVSSIIAHEVDGRSHFGADEEAELRRVRVDVNDVRIDFDAKPLVDYLEDYDAQMQILETKLQGRKLLRLTYEDDIQDDPRSAYARVCAFLGLTPAETSINLSRTNPFPVREMIESRLTELEAGE